MKKKLFSVLAATIVLVVCVATLVACNPYKADSIGGGDANAPVESNGGYVVKQGNYVYFINGYVGSDADTAWGSATKQGIVRADVKADGTVDPDSAKLVVPKSVYNANANGGIAIHGEWIYYASPNTNKNKSGVASTTKTDFMRTRIDGSVTQLLGTINTRSSEYMFTSSRVVYFTDNTISYIDFSGMKTNKSSDSAKGATSGILAENVENVVWSYDSDSIFYVQSAPSEDSYKNYNKLCTIKVDGSGQKVLATQDTFTTSDNLVNEQLNVFEYKLIGLYVESDQDVTLYYTKTHTLDSETVSDGLFMAKASDFKNTEKLVNKIASTTVFPLGYADGALAFDANSKYCWYNGENAENPVQVSDSSQKIWKVDATEGVAYFTASSSASALFKISYKEKKDNATVVVEEGIKTDWLVLDFVGDDFYFFASDDDNYMHTVNIKTFDASDEEAESTYVGIGRPETEEDED